MQMLCDAAIRYAQLVYYHDNVTKPQYGYNPMLAWQAFCQQFVGRPQATVILSVVGHSFRVEFNRLVRESKERPNVKGKSPAPTPGRWHQL